MPRKCILITGANGFLGRELTRTLCREERTVIALDHAAPPDHGLPCELIEADVRDRAMLEDIFNRHPIDAVVHLGGVSGQMLFREDPASIAEINIVATARLIETAWRAKVGRFVFASSLRAYGDMAGDFWNALESVPETAPFQPVDVYGASKAAGDALLRGYRMEHGLDGVALRIGAVYGPERRTESLVTRLLRAAIDGRPIALDRNTGRIAPYVYRDDVVTALRHALDAAETPVYAYNVAGPEALSDAELADAVRRVIPTAQITIPPPNGPLSGGQLDGALAARDLGYRPEFDIQKGIAATADWLRAL
ncbi:MAG: NAD(P)-dependent oxidoreductase [Alphaproteobacteria bacterium]|nr:NAD(P)-dependent oxidoreductase [Alphaproteobacteria bacterium]